MGHDRILTGAQKGLDFEILFDPFEEQFNLPALLVDIGNGLGTPVVLIGNKEIVFTRFRVAVTDPANRFELVSILPQRLILDRLITGDTVTFVHRTPFKHTVFGITPDAADKENSFLSQTVMLAIAVIALIKNQHTAFR